MLKVAFSPIYKYRLPDGHRFPMLKYELLPEQLILEGTIGEEQFFSPGRLSEEDILLTHSSQYLLKLKELNLSRKEVRAIGFPVREDLIIRGRHIAHGTYECANYALEHKVSINIAGGTHHAFANRGEGFCVFNDIAIASNMLLTKNLVKKILIIDLDVHQGNGTASIFKDQKNVFTFSIHGAKNYPVRKQKSDLDIALPDGCKDEIYLKKLKSYLPHVIDEFKPELIFYLAGVDVLSTDKLGRLGLTRNGCKERDKYIYEQCMKNDIPIAVVMGGGYSYNMRDIIEAHANTFRLAQEMYF